MNAHEVLGVTPGATPSEIKIAYRRACARWHPDRPGGDLEEFNRVQLAYAILTKAPCTECGGTGRVKIRQGFFLREELCPLCWKK